MIYPDVDTETWRKRFNLNIVESECASCKKTFKTTVPVLLQGCAGLSTPTHECGERFSEVILTPKTDKAKDFWDSVVRGLS